MEEIKVNDYIRTKEGYVGKVLRLGDEFSYDCIFESGDYKYAIGFQNIVKHSSNIIDLIEVGDYVNGVQVVQNKNGTIYAGLCSDCDCYDEIISNTKDIKNIVTKERYNSIKYVIGE